MKENLAYEGNSRLLERVVTLVRVTRGEAIIVSHASDPHPPVKIGRTANGPLIHTTYLQMVQVRFPISVRVPYYNSRPTQL